MDGDGGGGDVLQPNTGDAMFKGFVAGRGLQRNISWYGLAARGWGERVLDEAAEIDRSQAKQGLIGWT